MHSSISKELSTSVLNNLTLYQVLMRVKTAIGFRYVTSCTFCGYLLPWRFKYLSLKLDGVMWHAVAQFVEALRKIPGSRGFDFR
jgi:hypothetical protein